MGMELWSSTAASNNSASPNGAPEGMAPSGVNDTIRQNMASARTWYENPQWVNLGYTHVYASTTSFTIATTDYTSIYHVGRRIKAVGTSTGTIYGTIITTAYSSSTTVTVSWDSGTLANETLTIYVGGLSKTNDAIPYLNKQSADVASATTIDLNAVRGDLVDVTGTTTITGITLAQGQERTIRFTGILTFTHGANLVLPTAANITTAAGDYAIVRGYASSVVRCVGYFRADGTALGATGSFVNLSASGKFSLGGASTVTIATGGIFSGACPTTTEYAISNEAAAAADDLDTIGSTGVVDRQIVIFRMATAGKIPTFKHNTGNIFNPAGSDIALNSVNDTIILQWHATLTKYLVVSSSPIKGSTLQVKSSLLATQTSTSSAIPRDSSKPQIGEGAEFTNYAFTPVSPNSTLKITIIGYLEATNAGVVGLYVDSTVDPIKIAPFTSVGAQRMSPTVLIALVPSVSTTARTYRMRYGVDTGTAYINRSSDNATLYGGAIESGIIIEEIA